MESCGADFVFWCGCNKRFYNICGSSKNPVMINCPFNIDTTEEGNRDIFFYLNIKRGAINKFEKNVVDFYDEDPSNRSFSIVYKNDTLKGYYNLLRKSNNKENDGGLTGNFKRQLLTDVVNEDPSYDVVDKDDGVTISISVTGYQNQELECEVTANGDHLIVSGLRKDDGKIYQFEINFKLDGTITKETISGQFLCADSSKNLMITAKAKVVSSGYYQY